MYLTLVPMSPAEFGRRSPTLAQEYADDLRTARGMTAEEALAESTRQLAELLPEGVDTEGVLLWTADVDGEVVGWLWVTLPGGAGRSGTAWIHNIEVDPSHRSKGYGGAILEEMEADLATRGVTQVGLNVFGHNPRAIRLYERHGFHVTAQQMAKSIAIHPFCDITEWTGPPGR